ncbi:hypothetical protein HII17_00865 [Thalassotalea sp. M1531]|uniref:VOC family protein n=1 Tax=Thalassotalea algicola TaxID=2716224 RepID=A0A7Y0L9J2_9GAMM|nr:hypothetical protein [Thalassotalea algicola]NMP30098.1 hypothetical protein [Thalassotalea algicola]
MRLALFGLIFVILSATTKANEISPPNTGVSGVYEVMIGTDEPEPLLTFLNQFGFEVIDKGALSAEQANKVYGVQSKLNSYRLQNNDIDSHGLIRILHWDKPISNGVGYAQPETVGQRMMVMRTKDIFHLNDIFNDARYSGEKWFATQPVYDDLYDMTEGKLNVINRRIGVREMAAYGELMNIVFYQRYGYTIPGYGTIDDDSPLATSEITHNDFILAGSSKEDMYRQTDYYRDVLGFKPEGPVVLDGDWQAGPKAVFNMADGASHWYRGFVSPNNIAGKLKFFVNPDPRPDRSHEQRAGAKGITLHSVFTDKLSTIHQLAIKHQLKTTSIIDNEFNEKAFTFVGDDGSTWQVLQQPKLKNPAVTELNFLKK